MKKTKIGSMLVVAMLLFVSFGVAGYNKEKLNSGYEYQIHSVKEKKEMDISLAFSSPVIEYGGNYATIKACGLSCSSEGGKPVLPVQSNVLTFPLGTRIVHVETVPPHPAKMAISKQIQPAYKPVALNMKPQKISCTPDKELYASDAPYPQTWYRYALGGGLLMENT
ncbi:MAG: hypothetical protein U9O96_06350 [Candidatus Thermoplasmatota archaeon]|nr:hypothetical protein [Candidatus Thermoplasmatota archaeon]